MVNRLSIEGPGTIDESDGLGKMRAVIQDSSHKNSIEQI